MRNIGLHIRLKTTISQVAAKALRMGIGSFQTFVSHQTGGYHRLTEQDKKTFLALRPHFDTLYLHASYWINPGQPGVSTRPLDRELKLAHELAFNYVILHPGARAAHQTTEESIDLIAQNLNDALKRHPHVHILLENTAHGGRSIGGDMQQLRDIREKIDQPERVNFCIDTAHAHVFGYDLRQTPSRHEFITLLAQKLGAQHIKLIHLNDAQHECSSHIDQHETPGAGTIGRHALIDFSHHPDLCSIPNLVELPVLSEEQEFEIMCDIAKWKDK